MRRQLADLKTKLGAARRKQSQQQQPQQQQQQQQQQRQQRQQRQQQQRPDFRPSPGAPTGGAFKGKKKPCRNFGAGKSCRFGDKCSFAHK